MLPASPDEPTSTTTGLTNGSPKAGPADAEGEVAWGNYNARMIAFATLARNHNAALDGRWELRKLPKSRLSAAIQLIRSTPDQGVFPYAVCFRHMLP